MAGEAPIKIREFECIFTAIPNFIEVERDAHELGLLSKKTFFLEKLDGISISG
jgi:hypothetical protein